MTRTILFATVAALAMTAPAQARPGDQDAERAQKSDARKARAQEQSQRGQSQRVERQARPQAAQRQPRIERQRVERAPRIERQRVERAPRIERQRVERAPRIERQRVERAPRIERQRAVRSQRPERVARTRDRIERRPAIEQRKNVNRIARQQIRQERQNDRLARVQERALNRFQRNDRINDRIQEMPNRRMFADRSKFERHFQRPSRTVGERLNLRDLRERRTERSNDWFNDFATQRYSSVYGASPAYFYNYDNDDGYLYRVNRDNYLVSAMYPVLGGAFSTGRVLPYGFDSYNVPYAYRSYYYDTPDYFYRYGDGGIYQVDSDTLAIQAVVALLTGQSLGIGQRLPLGYDAYNVPYAYRDRFYDTSDAWYRYDDGYIYQVDPYSRMIEGMYPASYGGYSVGYPLPAYGSYGGYAAYPSAVPYDYQSLYYDAPGYDYYYANNGIYQVDPTSQLVSALVALVSGANFGVGQQLPLGYDAYNVPSAYRASYYDTPSSIYRYDDGYIYGANPRTRMIESVVPVANDGFAVGYPVPAGYPGYAVPPLYSDLYYAQPGYDYRYADGGIYQIDPQTRMVEAVAALLTGQSFGVGQVLPAGYDAYNVPYAYRDRYADTADDWYRYADGNIYQVDPRTRVIRTVMSVA